MGDKDLVNEEFCDRKHQEILRRVLLHEKYFNGGDDDLEGGVRYKMQILWGDYLLRKKTTMGWIDWIYRTVIGAMLTWLSAAVVLIIQKMGSM